MISKTSPLLIFDDKEIDIPWNIIRKVVNK
jgi:hypothetical protein